MENVYLFTYHPPPHGSLRQLTQGLRAQFYSSLCMQPAQARRVTGNSASQFGVRGSQLGVKGKFGVTIRRQRAIRLHNSASGGNSASCRNSASGDNSASLRNPASDDAASQCSVTNNNAASPIRLQLQVVSTPPPPGALYICVYICIYSLYNIYM